MNRPTVTDLHVLDRLRDSDQFNSLIRSAITYGDNEKEVLACRDDILRLLQGYTSWDVYGFCSKLDREGWAVDDGIYEMVEAILSLRDRIHRQVIIEWADRVFVIPPYKEGTEVKFKYRRADYIGTVYAHNKEGKSYVKCKELGHVPEGEIGTQGVVLEWEKLKLWNNV